MSSLTVKSFKSYQIPAGWRNWLILCVESPDGILGFSEFTDSNSSQATLMTAIDEIGNLLKNRKFNSIEEIVLNLRHKYRQALPGIMFKAISAFENALWDLKSKSDGKLISSYFPSSNLALTNQNFKCYWSHCPTTRIRASEHIGLNPIQNYDDLVELGIEISKLKFLAFKTNLVQVTPSPAVLMPGFNRNFDLATRNIPNNYPESFRNVLESIVKESNNFEIIIDFNFNLNYDNFISIQDSLHGLKIKWLEIDFDDFDLYEQILKHKQFPVCTGENVLGIYNYNNILNDDRIEIISIDLLWNGLQESLKIAEKAIARNKKIAVHNYCGSLATSMALVFLSMLPPDSIELLEYDYDDVNWRDTIVSNPAKFSDGSLEYIPGLGWNNDFLPNKLNLWN
jgi:L-alanine-DL-glutamate epimerase-like enolase superfamily enzyme